MSRAGTSKHEFEMLLVQLRKEAYSPLGRTLFYRVRVARRFLPGELAKILAPRLVLFLLCQRIGGVQKLGTPPRDPDPDISSLMTQPQSDIKLGPDLDPQPATILEPAIEQVVEPEPAIETTDKASAEPALGEADEAEWENIEDRVMVYIPRSEIAARIAASGSNGF